MKLARPKPGKYTGITIVLPHFGSVLLGHMLAENAETQIYFTNHGRVLVKMFDLSCGRPDEVSYGPYVSFTLELANFEEVMKLSELAPFVPAYYGANIDYERKHAYIAMEYLEGDDLKSWCETAAASGYESDWLDQFREVVYETLSIVYLFHSNGIILIDFKPDNIIRLQSEAIKFVDLGALYMPRHRRESDTYVHSATPDHAEVLIDASNLQTGVPPSEASDVFAAGVALFEMATGRSRLSIEPRTADEMIEARELYAFRDSQIRDVWQSFPHLKEVLPLLRTQLQERQLLFSELWHLLKAYVARGVDDWESIEREQRDQIVMSTGTTFIMEQLPQRLVWLAGPIARATALRSLRVKSVVELMTSLANPVSDYVREDVERSNCFVECLRSLDQSVDFVNRLNTWEVRADRTTDHWAIAAPVAYAQLAGSAEFIFLTCTHRDEEGHEFWHVVDEFEADETEAGRVTLAQVGRNRHAWLGRVVSASWLDPVKIASERSSAALR